MAEIVDIVMPESDEEGTEATLEAWLKHEGDFVDRNDPLLEVATDKVTMEVPAPVCGIIREVLVQPGDMVEAGMVLGRMEHVHQHKAEEQAAEKKKDAGEAPAEEQKPSAAVDRTEVRLSPAVRKLVEEHSLDTALVPGSGRGGRITVKDVESYLQRLDEEDLAPTGPELEEKLLPHNNMRLQIADHMIMSALETAPHVTAVFECDMSRVIAHRSRHKEDYQQRGARLTFTSYFVLATVTACRHAPAVNGEWREDGIQLFDHVNVGIATALGDQGLIVPVIKGAEDMDLFTISEQLGDLTERARSKKLSVSDVKGATISITNYGTGGSLFGTPIINQPNSAIVGIGAMQKRPKVVEVGGKDEIQIRPMLYVTLTVDHRGIDGFTANQWLSTFVETLESF